MSRAGIANGFRKVTHCIFDMDGLLLDTEKLYTQASQIILDEFGKTYTMDVKAKVMGLHTYEVSKIMVDSFALPISYEEYGKRQREITERIMVEAELMPDTEPIYEEVVRQIASAFGKKYPFEVRMKMLGTSEQRSAEIAVNDLGLPITIDEYMVRYRKLCREMLVKSELLKDTEIIFEEIMKEIASRYDKILPFETRMKILGTTNQRSAELMVNDLKLPITVEEYLEQFYKLCAEKLPTVNKMKGAERLLQYLHSHKVPLALATSSSETSVKLKMVKHQDMFKLFMHRVCGSSDPEVKHGKPAPDIFLIAAARFPDKPNPAQCLVFEDAPNGVAAARKAGMQVVMVPAPTTPEEMRKEATLVLNTLEDFKPELFGLPAFPENS